MEAEYMPLCTAVVAAVDILRGTTDPINDRVQAALAVLDQALAIPIAAPSDVCAIEDSGSIDLARPARAARAPTVRSAA